MSRRTNRTRRREDARDSAPEDGAVDRLTLLAALEDEGAPTSLRRLAEHLDLEPSDSNLAALEADLARLVRAGEVIRNRRDRYLLVRRADLVPGRVQGHRDGFGFLIPDEGERDIFLPARQMRRLMDGDRAAVQIRRHDSQGRPVGALIEVLERAHSDIVGRLRRESGITFLVPDNPRLPDNVLIPPDGTGGARPGQVVLVHIDEYPEEDRLAIGRVTRVIGDIDAPGVEVETAVHAFGLRHEWPGKVLEQAEAFGTRVPASAKDGRLDLRELPLVTIDGEDARDFDDALYCEPDGDGWRLLVAIADVSHYVQPASPLDREASLRGTSVYFPNRVIPMLPEALSNGLCSLNPDVDRLCMVCEMHVGPQGRVDGAQFHSAVMRSAARLTYTEVETLLDTGRGRRKLTGLKTQIHHLRDVYGALSKARRRRGALDFDMPALTFEFDEAGHISGLSSYHRGVSHRIVEECMIAANVEAARFLRRHRVPTLYRVHEGPSGDKLEELRLFLATFGKSLPKGQTLKPKAINHVLHQLRDHVQLELVETVVLRSMQQAIYQPRNIGHFGLALPAYAHFTSPIRRYPDLLVHRGIRQVLEHRSARGFAYGMPEMQRLGELTSQAERRADEATWDAQNRLKCEYMQDHLGGEFDAVVTGVVPFGLFVKVVDLQVEGLVHVSSLGKEYFHHDPVRRSLAGERSGTVYQLTDALRVRVIRVSVEDRKIDFEAVDAGDGGDDAAAGSPEATAEAGSGSRRRRRRRRR